MTAAASPLLPQHESNDSLITRHPALVLVAVGLTIRVLIVTVVLQGNHGELERYLGHGDGLSYVDVARMLVTGVRSLNEWNERVFLGWPLMIAGPGALAGYAQACLSLGVALAVLLPVLFWKLTNDFWAAAFLTVMTPTWLLQSSLGMSEPAFLICQLGALLALLSGWPLLGSALAAACMVVRPNGVFVWLGLALCLWQRKQHARLALHAALAAVAVVAVVACNLHYYGDALHQLHLYHAQDNMGPEMDRILAAKGWSAGFLGIPFQHLLLTPFLVTVPAWKIAFIWLHAIAILFACAVGFRQTDRSELDQLMLVWAVLNTAFVVSTGPYWGFHSFDRFCIWALPAYVYLLRRFIPKRAAIWIGFGAASLLLAIWSQARYF